MLEAVRLARFGGRRGIFAPLGHAVFRRIWTASLLSNLGLLIMGVGAAWSMTQLTGSADLVALVQTALMLPVALVSAPAGAVADMFDRRKVGLVALSIALTGALCLTTLAWFGAVTPVLLLLFCFFIGSGMALFGPAWQASVAEQSRFLPQSRSMALAIISREALAPRSEASLSPPPERSRLSRQMRFYTCPSLSSCFFGVVCRSRTGFLPSA